ncbi:MAG: metalloprotease TldD [Deltaproteobacteria bacterium]|nr:metalloprotease TldD [Deltaproteobacteria bacterium]
METPMKALGPGPEALGRALSEVRARQVDDCDIYFEHTVAESLALDEGLVKRASRAIHQGVGVRAVVGDRTGYAHADLVDEAALLEAARAARAIATESSHGGTVAVRQAAPERDLYRVDRDPIELGLHDKLVLLQQIDARARAWDPRIKQVQASFVCETRTVIIVTADGRIVTDERPLSRLSISCIAVDPAKGQRQASSSGGGGRWTYEVFADRWEAWTDEAARRAILLLDAVDAPAGAMDVVLGPGWPGILLHEAVGHGLEGDFNRKRTSAFSGLVGKPVASPLVTVVDDGTIATRRGSLNVDDEGTPTQRNVLIEGGILKGYLQDRMNARLMGEASTGSGRRESYASAPLPRMTNTFMLAGQDDPADIIRSVKRGVYAVAFGGGQVDITSGKFVFSGAEAYLIEDGKVTAPVKGATFIGNGPDVLKRVAAVGHDLKLDEGIGTCGKDGQSVPVGVGLPTILVNDLTVGGVAVRGQGA